MHGVPIGKVSSRILCSRGKLERFGGIAVHPQALSNYSVGILYVAHASIPKHERDQSQYLNHGIRTTGEQEEKDNVLGADRSALKHLYDA